MIEQLDHLARLSRWRNVTVRVLPIGLGARVEGLPPFGLADFADRRSLLYRCDATGVALWDEPTDVLRHRAILDRLDSVALAEPESRQVIERWLGALWSSSPVR
jgi:hypothetical protein